MSLFKRLYSSSQTTKKELQIKVAKALIAHDSKRMSIWMGEILRLREDPTLDDKLKRDYFHGINNFLLHLRTEISRLEKYLPEIDLRDFKTQYNILEEEQNKYFESRKY